MKAPHNFLFGVSCRFRVRPGNRVKVPPPRIALERLLCFLQANGDVSRAAQPPTLYFFQATSKKIADGIWRFVREMRPVGIAVEYGGKGIGCRITGKGAATRKGFVESAPERPNVRSLINLLTPGLFRAHVAGCAEYRAVGGDFVGVVLKGGVRGRNGFPGGWRHGSREAEV